MSKFGKGKIYVLSEVFSIFQFCKKKGLEEQS